MKSITHDLFSAGLMAYLATAERSGPVALVLAVFSSVLTNVVIDMVGHSSSGGVLRRRWLAHSVLTAPLWGAAAWLLVCVVAREVPGAASDSSAPALFAFLGAVAGWSHLLLDSVTEGGVFGLGRRRLALAHFAYDNVPLNIGFALLGLAMLFLAAFLQ